MYGYVYKTTDVSCGKIYVGQHKSNVFDESYFGSGIIIQSIAKKHGNQRFICEVLEECDSEDMLNEREIFWIDKLNSRDPNVGYNIASGGAFGDSGYHLGMLGKKQSDYQRQSVSQALKGKPKSELTRKKLSTTHIGNSNASGGKGMRFIHKGYDTQKRVKEDEIQKWIEAGWEIGKSPKVREETQKHYKEKYANGTYITNGTQTKFVDNSQLDTFISNGWTIGKSSNIYKNRKHKMQSTS